MENIRNILKKQGLKTSKTVSASPSIEPSYTCSICHDFCFVYHNVPRGDPDFGKAFTCKCQAERMKKERKNWLLKYCELPVATEKLTFEKFDGTGSLKEAYRSALEVADPNSKLKWLTLMAKKDRGKTHLAIAICRKWLEQGEPAKYVFVPLMLDELRRGYNREGEESYDKQLETLMNVPLLVLDDLGAQQPTAWAMEKLITIIDYRYIRGFNLVVTTNKPLGKLPGDDEGRIASRLQRFELGKIVVIDAIEYRLRRKK